MIWDSNPIKSSKHQICRRGIPCRNQFFNSRNCSKWLALLQTIPTEIETPLQINSEIVTRNANQYRFNQLCVPLSEIRNESTDTCWKPQRTVVPKASCRCKSRRTNGRGLRRGAPRTNFLPTIPLIPQSQQENEATFFTYRTQEVYNCWNIVLTQHNSARRIPENTILQPSWITRFECHKLQIPSHNRSNRSNSRWESFVNISEWSINSLCTNKASQDRQDRKYAQPKLHVNSSDSRSYYVWMLGQNQLGRTQKLKLLRLAIPAGGITNRIRYVLCYGSTIDFHQKRVCFVPSCPFRQTTKTSKNVSLPTAFALSNGHPPKSTTKTSKS